MSVALTGIMFGQGVVSGVVTDSTTGDGLVGVNVVVVGTSLGSATDIDGTFRISSVPIGQRTLKISYIGYAAKKIDVVITGKEKALAIQLAPQVIEGQVVEVYGQLRGQIAAINQQVNSNTIMNVVSQEKIQELPDANAAEAIGRLPGVALTRSGGEASGIVVRGLSSKFSNITLDGVKIPPTDPSSRDVDLSMIAQGSLSGIELYKTLTPDQDADAIAGGINLVTRKAPSERLIRADVKGDYNNIMKSANQYDFALHYSERFFDDLIGVQLQGNTERKIRSTEEVTNSYASYNNKAFSQYGLYDINLYNNDYNISRFEERFIDETRKRNGLQAIFDINTPDSGSVKLSGTFAQTDRNSLTYTRRFPVGDFIYEMAEQILTTRSASLQGKNYFLGLTADWNISFAESQMQNPNDYRLAFQGVGENPGAPQLQANPEIWVASAANDFAGAVLDSSFLYKTEDYDKELTAQLNVSKTVSFGDKLIDEIKIGGKHKDKSRWMNSSGFAWNNYLATTWLNLDGTTLDFSGTPFAAYGSQDHPSLNYFLSGTNQRSHTLLGLYNLTPLIDANYMQLYENMTRPENAKIAAAINYGPLGDPALSEYFITERVSSAYLMNTLNFGQSLTLILGARIEAESNDYLSHYATAGASGTAPVLSLPASAIKDSSYTYQQTSVLPNIQAIVKPTDFLNIRAAAYKALARPDFSARLPKAFYDDQTTANSVTIGNPHLQNAAAWNYEVSTQWYGNTIGLFTVSAFYKRIDNLFHTTNRIPYTCIKDSTQQMWVNGTTISNAQVQYFRLENTLKQMGVGDWLNNPLFVNQIHSNSTIFLTASYNSPQASSNWGIEVEHQMNFGFLPVSWLHNLTLTYNFTIMNSETYLYLSAPSVADSSYTPATGGHHPTPAQITVDPVQTITLQKKPMEDQPQLYGNAALGYDIGGFSGRLSVFYQGQYTRTYSGDGTSDNVVNEFIKWDIALKQQVTPKISFLVNFNNIFNRSETQSRYNNLFDWGYLPSHADTYGTTVDFGVRVSL